MIFTRCLTVGCVMMSGLTATSNAHTSRRSSLHLVRTASCSVRLQALPSLVRTSSLSAMESSTSPADPHAVRMMSIWSPADSAAASRASTSSRSDITERWKSAHTMEKASSGFRGSVGPERGAQSSILFAQETIACFKNSPKMELFCVPRCHQEGSRRSSSQRC